MNFGPGCDEVCMARIMEMILMTVVACCFVWACITDRRACYVYRCVWWICWSGGVGLLLVRTLCFLQNVRLIPLLLFAILQEVWFAGMYGRADCHAFLACAVVECAYGMGMKEYLCQMLLAFGILAVVQGVRGNINSEGNLKKPVPFLPYITGSFVMVMVFFGC